LTDPPTLGGACVGLGAVGIRGFPPTFGATPGLTPTGGPGLGLLTKGGGTLAAEAVDVVVSSEVEGVLFQGVVVPFAGPIPGKTETGLA